MPSKIIGVRFKLISENRDDALIGDGLKGVLNTS
jgi:hypothetical protein